MSKKVIMLTKPNCTQCNSLKMYLKLALRDKYEPDIVRYDQVENEKEFNKFSKQFEVQSLPALIFEDDILRQISPTATTAFLEKHLGKR